MLGSAHIGDGPTTPDSSAGSTETGGSGRGIAPSQATESGIGTGVAVALEMKK